MAEAPHLKHELQEAEQHLLEELRAIRRKLRLAAASGPSTLTVGQTFADTVAATMGSWRFMITKTTIPVFWISADGIGFILLTQAITDLTALLKKKAS